MKQSLAFLLLVGITIFSPFPVMLIAMLVAIVRFRAYKKAFFSAFLYDALYFGGTVYDGMPFGYMIPLSVYMLAVSAIVIMLRTRLREYAL